MMREPQAGNHNDAYEMKSLFTWMSCFFEEAGISLKGVFMNADLDVEDVRGACADKEGEKLISPAIVVVKKKIRNECLF